MSGYEAFASSRLLRNFKAEEVAEIYEIGKSLRLPADEALFHRGDPGDAMYVVLDGRIEIRFPSGIESKLLGPGDFLGELALVSPTHRRTASAVAIEEARLRMFDQEAFDQLLESKPKLLVSLLKWISSYLLSSEQRLTDGLLAKNLELEKTFDYLQRTREELDQQELLARTDELTGLYNRRSMQAEIETFLEHSGYEGGNLALVLIDLDEFKQINDSHGHPAGDAVLKALAGIIRSSIRRIDLPCRIGGDEFAVVFPQVGSELARIRAEEIRQRIAAQPFELRGGLRRISVTVSLGGALHAPGESVDSLFRRADERLYHSKRTGRNRLSWAEDPAVEVSSGEPLRVAGREDAGLGD